MGKFLLLILGILAITCFFSPQKVKAAEPGDVVINEVSSRPSTGEWIELFNKTNSDIDLINYSIEDGNIENGNDEPEKLDAYTIVANGYLVLKKDTDFSFQLNDLGDIIILKKSSDKVDQVSYGTWADGNVLDNAPAPLINQTIARIPNGHDSNNDATDFIIQLNPTEGTENPLPAVDTVPTSFGLISPLDNTKLTTGQEINFSWEASIDPEGQQITYDFYLSCSSDFPENPVGTVLESPAYTAEEVEYNNTTCPTYYWKVNATDGSLDTKSLPEYFAFALEKPVYSKNIIVNEILPRPSNGMENEFIELYNGGSEAVDLEGWFLDDADGGSIPYLIPAGTTILADDYLFFKKSVTKLSLLDSGDYARLLYPDGLVASSTDYTEYASLDLTWARDTDGDWEWTEEITKGAKNIIYLTPEDDNSNGMGGDEEETIIINSVPIEIKTGDFRDFNEKLVAVSGTVITTSGNTFYLDDGSGQAKIYIQDKSGIDKPPMHRGDIFAIIGIVNLYRNTWRILPQKQSDVKLVQCVKGELDGTGENSAATAKTTAKSFTAGKSTAQARAPAATLPIVKQVKAAVASAETQKPESPKNSFWVQIIEALTGLALIFLILLIIKVRKFPKVKVIGGHFGEDET